MYNQYAKAPRRKSTAADSRQRVDATGWKRPGRRAEGKCPADYAADLKMAVGPDVCAA